MSTTKLALSTYHVASKWASRVVALLFSALSLYVAFLFSERSTPIILILATLGISISLLAALFVESALSRLLMSRWYVEFDQDKIIVEAKDNKQVFDLQQPYELNITKTEGDHKERGGNVLIELSQNQQKATLLGALGHGELPKECEPLLASAKEASFSDLQKEGTNALWLAKDGDMARFLPVFANHTA